MRNREHLELYWDILVIYLRPAVSTSNDNNIATIVKNR